jgi:hypothetical protein
MRLVILAITAAAVLPAQDHAASGGTSALDFEFFKTRVQPIFLAKRARHARCYACHSTGTPYRLQRLSPGATEWNDEQSRKNFDSSVSMVNLNNVDASPLLLYPLAESAGGNHFHPGGKHWESKSDAEWKTLSDWVHGKKAGH